MEVKKEVKTYNVRMMCEKEGCGGEMMSNGTCFTSIPAQYTHECIKCRNKENYLKIYPTRTYEEIV